MVTNTIDYVVGGIIILVGIFIFYRALKEPMDLLGGALGKVFGSIRDYLSGGSTSSTTVIKYG